MCIQGDSSGNGWLTYPPSCLNRVLVISLRSNLMATSIASTSYSETYVIRHTDQSKYVLLGMVYPFESGVGVSVL